MNGRFFTLALVLTAMSPLTARAECENGSCALNQLEGMANDADSAANGYQGSRTRDAVGGDGVQGARKVSKKALASDSGVVREPRGGKRPPKPNVAADSKPKEKAGFFSKIGGFLKDNVWAIGGASAGGLIGFLLGGPIGALIGAAVGGLAGHYGPKLLGGD